MYSIMQPTLREKSNPEKPKFSFLLDTIYAYTRAFPQSLINCIAARVALLNCSIPTHISQGKNYSRRLGSRHRINKKSPLAIVSFTPAFCYGMAHGKLTSLDCRAVTCFLDSVQPNAVKACCLRIQEVIKSYAYSWSVIA